eukprot:403333656
MKMRPEDCQHEIQAAQDLIKKLKKEKLGRMERFKQKEIEVQQMERDQVNEILRQRQEDENKKHKEIEQRREQIMIKMQLMKEERERRQRDWSEQKQQSFVPVPRTTNLLQLQNYQSASITPQNKKLLGGSSAPSLPLYIEMEQKFKLSIESEELKKRKMILQQIRQFKKPIQREEFEEHQQKYDDEKERLLEEKQKLRQQRMLEQERQMSTDLEKLQTKTYQEVALIDLQKKEEEETKEEMKKLLIEKKESYARYVREMHLPPKNKAKEQELQEMITALKHPVRSSRKIPPGTEINDMHRSRTMSRGGQAHSRNISMSQMSQNGNEEVAEQSQDAAQVITKRSQKHGIPRRNNNNFVPKPPLPNGFHTQSNQSMNLNNNNTLSQSTRPVYTDYLKERRQKRELQYSQSGSAHKEHLRDSWMKSLQNKKLSKKEKFIKIKEKAREIEEMALRKEQLLNVKGAIDHYGNLQNLSHNTSRKIIHPATGQVMGNARDEKNIEDTLEVNEMLVDAIKAKLAILDDIN